MKYSIDYFIKKFSAIPSRKWTTAVYSDAFGRSCALGHCGAGARKHGLSISRRHTSESKALLRIAGSTIIAVNDNSLFFGHLGKSPRTRVVNYLKNLKKVRSKK
jgi:hypothetical protein